MRRGSRTKNSAEEDSSMSELEDYLIYEVHYEDESYGERIAEVRTRKFRLGTTGVSVNQFSKQKVVDSIK